ncbi:MAG: hypothetical protein LC115_05785 [Bacteroidia bacterium]|nr:hypothetical protein [Bacteroidia bacterium]
MLLNSERVVFKATLAVALLGGILGIVFQMSLHPKRVVHQICSTAPFFQNFNLKKTKSITATFYSLEENNLCKDQENKKEENRVDNVLEVAQYSVPIVINALIGYGHFYGVHAPILWDIPLYALFHAWKHFLN